MLSRIYFPFAHCLNIIKYVFEYYILYVFPFIVTKIIAKLTDWKLTFSQMTFRESSRLNIYMAFNELRNIMLSTLIILHLKWRVAWSVCDIGHTYIMGFFNTDYLLVMSFFCFITVVQLLRDWVSLNSTLHIKQFMIFITTESKAKNLR